MLPEVRIVGGLVLFIVGALFVTVVLPQLKHLGDLGTWIMGAFAALVALVLSWLLGGLIYHVARAIFDGGRERMRHPALMIVACLSVAGFAAGAWFGLQTFFGWQSGVDLALVSIVLAAFTYASLENLVVWVRERTARR